MNRSKSKLAVAAGLLSVLASQRHCMADILYADGNFNLPNYSQINYVSNPQVTDTVLQSLIGGDPGAALQTLVSGPESQSFSYVQGLVNTSFVFDPGADGRLLEVSGFVDKYIQTSGNLTSNFFRPLILQNGDYFIAGIALSTSQGVWNSGGESGLVASDFSLFNFTTGAISPTLYPDFSSGLMEFGLANRISLSSPPNFPSYADIRYDNLSFDLRAVPVPSSGILAAIGIVGLLP